MIFLLFLSAQDTGGVVDEHFIEALLLQTGGPEHGDEGFENVAVADAALEGQVGLAGQVLGKDDLVQPSSASRAIKNSTRLASGK